MKRAIAVLGLLGALRENAGPTCPDSYPMECEGLCIYLRTRLFNAVGTREPLLFWLLDLTDDPFEPAGCDIDARAWHTADECTYARAWIYRWDHEGICLHFPQECEQQTAECMRTHPYWDGCFCGHPGDGC
jgi:hypothetical protein